jgi:hypothetical protein
MNENLSFASHGRWAIFSAAVVAGVIAGALVSGVVLLFQSRGAPLELQAAAERACGHHLYRSEQVACMNEWLPAKRASAFAKR